MHSNIYFVDELASQTALIQTLAHNQPLPALSAFIDGRGLSCPMPLLKAKIALRQLSKGDHLYLVATDKNACHDIAIFCQKNQLPLQSWSADNDTNPDTIFHFIIHKNT